MLNLAALGKAKPEVTLSTLHPPSGTARNPAWMMNKRWLLVIADVQERMVLISHTLIKKCEEKSTRGPIYRSISRMNEEAKILDVIKIYLICNI